MGIYALWRDASASDANVAWVREAWNAIQPHARGVYVNELGADDGEDRVRQAYGANYGPLTQIKGKYDPQNLFQLNANVKPA